MRASLGQKNEVSASTLSRLRLGEERGMRRTRRDVLYCEGPGDIVNAYKSWKEGINHLSETNVTFSGQVFEFRRSENLSLYAVSLFARADKLIE